MKNVKLKLASVASDDVDSVISRMHGLQGRVKCITIFINTAFTFINQFIKKFIHIFVIKNAQFEMETFLDFFLYHQYMCKMTNTIFSPLIIEMVD